MGRDNRKQKATASAQDDGESPNQTLPDDSAQPGPSTGIGSPAQTLRAVVDTLGKTEFAVSPEIPRELLQNTDPSLDPLISSIYRLAMRTYSAEKALFDSGRLPLPSASNVQSPIAHMEQQIGSIAQSVNDISAGSSASRNALPRIQTQLEDLSQRFQAQTEARDAARTQAQLIEGIKGTIMASLGPDLNHIKKHVDSVHAAVREAQDRKIVEAEATARDLDAQVQDARTEVGDLREMVAAIQADLLAANTALKTSVDHSNGPTEEVSAPPAASSSISIVDEARSVRENAELLVQQSRSYATFISTILSRPDPGRALSHSRRHSNTEKQSLPELWQEGTQNVLAAKAHTQELEGEMRRLKDEMRSLQFVLHQIQKGVFSLEEWKSAAVSQENAAQSDELDLGAATDIVDIAKTMQSTRRKYNALKMHVYGRRPD